MTSAQVRRLQSRVAHTAARFVEHAARNHLAVADLPNVKLPWYRVVNQTDDGDEPDTATVFIFEEIGGSLGIEAKTFVRELEEITAPTIKVRINSPGGSVFDAIAIHNALLHHQARILVYVDALAASAASVIAMAGDELVMMPGSQLMIHDASAHAEGNASDMAKISTFLDRQSDNLAGFYQRRGGGELAEWRELMLAETWMYGREAVEFGLADRVEQAPGPDPDPEVDALMTRSFDLAQFRYAGRRAAPPPARRQAAARVVGRKQRSEDSMPAATIPRSSADAARRAADARADSAASNGGGRRARSASTIGPTRSVAFTAKEMRAELVTRDGREFYRLDGYASVVEQPYEMWDVFGPYEEVISRGAFDRTLAANPDVAFLVNHRGITMARTTNGTLELSADPIGLRSIAYLNPGRQDVQVLVSAVDDKLITEMSFGFTIPEGAASWSEDFATFRIDEVDLDRGDTSAVNYGANPATTIAARSQEIMRELDYLPAGAARAAIDRLRARHDLAPVRAPAATGPLPTTTGAVDASGGSVDLYEALLAID